MRYFVSYPKSGRTWVRFMLNDYLCRLRGLRPTNVFEIENARDSGYPLEWTHLTAAMVMKLPYWSMGCFDHRQLAGATCVLLVRNFYATLASAYHQAVHRIRVFSGTPAQFVRSPRYGAIKLVSFYNLYREITPVLGRSVIVSYDAMLTDPIESFPCILRALDIEIDATLIERVVEGASFENMKELSRSPAYAGTVLAPKDPDDPKTYKVRVGGKSKYQDLFSADDLAYVNRVIEDLLIDADAPHFQGCWERREQAVGV